MPLCRQEKAVMQRQQKALEAAAQRSAWAAEDAQARLAEREDALKLVGLERRASQQERCGQHTNVKPSEACTSGSAEMQQSK
jgi:hypothetical protein